MFQNRLKELREAAGYKSQQAFASKFGVAQSTVGGWESGEREPKHENIKKLATFFGVSIDYLLDLTDDPCFSGGPLASFLMNRRGNESQDEFAKKCGISAELLKRIESGFRKIDMGDKANQKNSLSTEDIKAIAKGLSVDWRYIACLYAGYNPNRVSDTIIPHDDRTGVLSHQVLHDAYFQKPLTPDEMLLITTYQKLNPVGQRKLLENADDLVQSGKYDSTGYGDEKEGAQKMA